MCVCLQCRNTTPVLQPHWFPLTQTPLCSSTRQLLRLDSSDPTEECLAELYYLCCSLGLLDCVRLLTTSSARAADMLSQQTWSENKEPFECASAKTGWLQEKEKQKRDTEEEERSPLWFYSFHLHVFCISNIFFKSNRITCLPCSPSLPGCVCLSVSEQQLTVHRCRSSDFVVTELQKPRRRSCWDQRRTRSSDWATPTWNNGKCGIF